MYNIHRFVGFQLWMLGNKRKKIPPYRSLVPRKMSSVKQQRDYSVLKTFFKFCEQGLTTNVPEVSLRTSSYMDGAYKEISLYLEKMVPHTRAEARIRAVSTWSKLVKPSMLRKHTQNSNSTSNTSTNTPTNAAVAECPLPSDKRRRTGGDRLGGQLGFMANAQLRSRVAVLRAELESTASSSSTTDSSDERIM